MDIRWFKDSPSAGHPDCLCSVCGFVIPASNGAVVRMFNVETNEEARFHNACIPGLVVMDDPEDSQEYWTEGDPRQ